MYLLCISYSILYPIAYRPIGLIWVYEGVPSHHTVFGAQALIDRLEVLQHEALRGAFDGLLKALPQARGTCELAGRLQGLWALEVTALRHLHLAATQRFAPQRALWQGPWWGQGMSRCRSSKGLWSRDSLSKSMQSKA